METSPKIQERGYPSMETSPKIQERGYPSMETSPKIQERGNPTVPAAGILPSPTSNSSSTSSSSTSSHSNGSQHHHPHSLHHHHYMSHPLPPPPPSTPTTPKQQQQQQQIHQTITRSEPNNPYPTTFVQADTSSFKQVVQMLTGSSETAKLASQSKPTANPDHQSPHHHQQPMSKNPIPPIKTASKLKPSKLYERRNNLKNLKINPLGPGFASNSGFSPRNAEILSPSMLDFPSLVLSPVTPLIPDPFNRSPSSLYNGKPNNINYSSGSNNIVVNKAAEERAIAEKGFYLHPSPASTPRESEPRLLPLFPVTSPRVSGSGSNCS